jgi:TonB family protein
MDISTFFVTSRNRSLALRSALRSKTAFQGVLVLFTATVLCFGSLALAQQGSKADRRLVTRVEPDYPPVLKVRQIGGTVRLELTISPKGAVKSISILGGNPVLAESAIAAVKQWIYAPADAVTTEKVSLEFNPYR